MGDGCPDLALRVSSLKEAQEWVRARTGMARENFSVLSVFVPRELRDDLAAVYAFCRVSDDIADETGADDAARAQSLVMLREWRAMLIQTHERAGASPPGQIARARPDGPPAHPVMLALGATIARHALALRHFTDLLDAFEEDQRVTRWASLTDLERYSTRSANPVGRLVLGLFSVREDVAVNARLFAASDALCTALQLTNFWQDVRRDLLDRGRIYVPCDELGLDADRLQGWIRGPRDPAAQRAFADAMRPCHARTWTLFEQGADVVSLAPVRARRVLSLFWQGGVRTLMQVRAASGGELWKRPAVSKARKCMLLARECLRRHGRNEGQDESGASVA